MSIKIVKGNLLDLAEAGHYDKIMHGCNCFHVMGGGIAGEIAKRYPSVVAVDRMTTPGDPSKLTTWTTAWAAPKDPEKHNYRIINLYTQYQPGADFISSLFERGIERISYHFRGKEIAIPRIGCGIGGGDWTHVEDTLLNQGANVDWVVCVL